MTNAEIQNLVMNILRQRLGDEVQRVEIEDGIDGVDDFIIVGRAYHKADTDSIDYGLLTSATFEAAHLIRDRGEVRRLNLSHFSAREPDDSDLYEDGNLIPVRGLGRR